MPRAPLLDGQAGLFQRALAPINYGVSKAGWLQLHADLLDWPAHRALGTVITMENFVALASVKPNFNSL